MTASCRRVPEILPCAWTQRLGAAFACPRPRRVPAVLHKRIWYRAGLVERIHLAGQTTVAGSVEAASCGGCDPSGQDATLRPQPDRRKLHHDRRHVRSGGPPECEPLDAFGQTLLDAVTVAAANGDDATAGVMERIWRGVDRQLWKADVQMDSSQEASRRTGCPARHLVNGRGCRW